jgi:hypothetical protein
MLPKISAEFITLIILAKCKFYCEIFKFQEFGAPSAVFTIQPSQNTAAFNFKAGTQMIRC